MQFIWGKCRLALHYYSFSCCLWCTPSVSVKTHIVHTSWKCISSFSYWLPLKLYNDFIRQTKFKVFICHLKFRSKLKLLIYWHSGYLLCYRILYLIQIVCLSLELCNYSQAFILIWFLFYLIGFIFLLKWYFVCCSSRRQ